MGKKTLLQKVCDRMKEVPAESSRLDFGEPSELPRSKLRGIKNQNLIAVGVGTLCSGG